MSAWGETEGEIVGEVWLDVVCQISVKVSIDFLMNLFFVFFGKRLIKTIQK